jgi:glycosyltransferase involved in cell wall biosynthesis
VRLLHVVPLLGSNAEYGGPARGTLRQAKFTAERGHDVEVVTLWSGSRPTSNSEDVPLHAFAAHRLPWFPGFSGLVSAGALFWLVRNHRRFDLIHFHAGREVWTLVAMLFARLLGVPYVLQTHGMLSPRSGAVARFYDACLTAPAVRGASTGMYLTNRERRELLETGWFREVDLVLNGVDNISPVVANRIDDAEVRIVTTARLHARKSIPDLVNAVANVHDGGYEVSLAILGPDEGDLPNIQKAVAIRSAESYINIVGGVPYAEVLQWLRGANAYVLPSRAEPFPNGLLEGLAAGLACVCTDECGIAPYIRESGGGVVSQAGAGPLSDAIVLLANRPQRRLFAEQGLKLCQEKFSIDSVVDSLLRIYLRVHEQRSA